MMKIKCWDLINFGRSENGREEGKSGSLQGDLQGIISNSLKDLFADSAPRCFVSSSICSASRKSQRSKQPADFTIARVVSNQRASSEKVHFDRADSVLSQDFSPNHASFSSRTFHGLDSDAEPTWYVVNAVVH